MTTPELVAYMAVIITALSAIGGSIAYLSNRPQTHAETLHTLTETLKNLSHRVCELEDESMRDNQRIHGMERLLAICVIGLQTLSNQLVREGKKPEWISPAELDQWVTRYLHQDPPINPHKHRS